MTRGESSGGPCQKSHGRLAGTLVVAEVAFSLILLVGAMLMLRTFANLHALAPGFEPAGVVAVTLSLPTDRYAGEGVRSAFFDALRERVAGAPGVSDVAVASRVFGGAGISFVDVEAVEGRSPMAAAGSVEVPSNAVSEAYFRALRIPLLAGRSFAEADGEDAVVVSRSLANRLWPEGDALGRRFRLAPGWPWRTIVGVAGDVEPRAVGEGRTAFHLYSRFARPDAAAAPPPSIRGFSERVVIVRAVDPVAIVPAVRAAVRAIDPMQPVGRVALVADLYADAFARERFVLQLMAAFGLIAVALTAAGIFGVLSQIVARRTREIGLRVALGARATDIARLVGVGGLVLVLAGTVLGIAGALALTRSLQALLFEVRPADPISFAAVTLVMMVVALAACSLPLRRAIRVDPAVALRVD